MNGAAAAVWPPAPVTNTNTKPTWSPTIDCIEPTSRHTKRRQGIFPLSSLPFRHVTETRMPPEVDVRGAKAGDRQETECMY